MIVNGPVKLLLPPRTRAPGPDFVSPVAEPLSAMSALIVSGEPLLFWITTRSLPPEAPERAAGDDVAAAAGVTSMPPTVSVIAAQIDVSAAERANRMLTA